MTMARAGVLVAVAGGIALAIHAAAYTKEKRQQVHCDVWRRARAIVTKDAAPRVGQATIAEWAPAAVNDDLSDPYINALWEARDLIALYPPAVSALVSALDDPAFVGLSGATDVVVSGREMPRRGHEYVVDDDLFRRAGRASWLLKNATGRPAGTVPVQTDPIYLADLARDWQRWLDDLDGGLACFPSLR